MGKKNLVKEYIVQILVQKNVGPQEILCKKNLFQKNVGQKDIGQKICKKNCLWSKKIGPKFLVPKIFGPKKISVQKLFWSKTNLGKNKFCSIFFLPDQTQIKLRIVFIHENIQFGTGPILLNKMGPVP